MKLMSSKPFASVMLALALIALAVMSMQPAAAGDLKPAFKASNGVVFTLPANNQAFTCAPGEVIVKEANTNTRSFPDSTGSVCTAVTTSADFAGNYVQQVGTPPSTRTWYRANWIEAYCSTGGSLLSYPVNGGPTILPDGCQTDAQIKARAN
jgi:hypothetical protein